MEPMEQSLATRIFMGVGQFLGFALSAAIAAVGVWMCYTQEAHIETAWVTIAIGSWAAIACIWGIVQAIKGQRL